MKHSVQYISVTMGHIMQKPKAFLPKVPSIDLHRHELNSIKCVCMNEWAAILDLGGLTWPQRVKVTLFVSPTGPGVEDGGYDRRWDAALRCWSGLWMWSSEAFTVIRLTGQTAFSHGPLLQVCWWCSSSTLQTSHCTAAMLLNLNKSWWVQHNHNCWVITG